MPTPARDSARPIAAASPPSAAHSTSSCRAMRRRLAPSAVRTATSRARPAAPTSSRLPALVLATASTISPAVMNGSQPRTRSGAAEQAIVDRLDQDAHALVGGGELTRQRAGERVEFGRGVGPRRRGGQSAEHLQRAGVTRRVGHAGEGGERQEHAGTAREPRSIGDDADHGGGGAVHQHVAPDHAGIAVIAAPPDPLGQHDGRRRPRQRRRPREKPGRVAGARRSWRTRWRS